MSEWRENLRIIYGVGGSIDAEENRGRRYFHVRVTFPQGSDWWPRSTETGSISEARKWIDEQENEYRRHIGVAEQPTDPKQAPADGGSK